MTLPSPWGHYFIHIQVAENATSTGHAKRGSVLVTIFGYKAPCRKTSLPSIADKATADNPVLRQCTTGGTPVTASHARMTMTVTGLPHGGRKANFPLICSTALNLSTWRCTPIPLSLFLSASLCVCLCFHAAIQDGIRCHFRCMGQR